MASLARSMTSSAFLNGKNTYFFVVFNRSFAAANADGLVHFTRFGANGWGVEDIFGGGDHDYDDMIVRFSLSS